MHRPPKFSLSLASIVLKGLLLAVLLTPFFGVWLPWAVACLAIIILAVDARGVRIDAVSIVVVLFLLWSALSFWTSLAKTEGWNLLLLDAGVLLLFLWARGRALGMDIAPLLTQAVVLSCVLGLVLFLVEPGTRFAGLFVTWGGGETFPNTLGSLLLLTWPIAFFVFREEAFWKRICVTGLLLGCLLLTGSRASVIIFCVQIFALFIGLKSFLKHYTITRFWSVLGTSLAVAVVVFAGSHIAHTRVHPTASVGSLPRIASVSSADPSIVERLQFWKESLQLVVEHPLTGFGPGSFTYAHQPLEESAFVTATHPHSWYLQLAVERGLPAVVLILVLIGMVAWYGWKKRADPLSFFVSLGVAAVLAHNVIDTTLTAPALALAFWLAMSVLAHDTHDAERSLLPQRIAAGILMLCLCATTVFRSYASDRLLFAAADHLNSSDAPSAKISIVLYTELTPLDPRGWSIRGDIEQALGNGSAALQNYEKGFRLGQMNYPVLADHLVESVLQQKDAEFLRSMRGHLEQLLMSYAFALHWNYHDAALDQSADDTLLLISTLTKAYPEHAKDFAKIHADIEKDISEWRAKEAVKPKGLLW